MAMVSITSTCQQSLDLARAINREARSNPNSIYSGKFVGIARGRVVVVADSMLRCLDALEKAEPDRLERVCLEATADYDGPHEVDGIAGFGFLNRFHYSNFGDPAQFGIETF